MCAGVDPPTSVRMVGSRVRLIVLNFHTEVIQKFNLVLRVVRRLLFGLMLDVFGLDEFFRLRINLFCIELSA